MFVKGEPFNCVPKNLNTETNQFFKCSLQALFGKTSKTDKLHLANKFF